MIDDEMLRKHASRFEKWSFDVTQDYTEYIPSKALEDRIQVLAEGKTALVLGAGMSSITSPFFKEWEEKKAIVHSEDPKSLEGFSRLFQYGGITVTPKQGIDVIPDLVKKQRIPAFLVFNYDCHLEIALILCGVGYESISYCGKGLVEITRVGTPKCTIYKPHGTSRLLKGPTPIVWPDWPEKGGEPMNQDIFERFEKEIQKKSVDRINILGYSGNWDPYVEKHFLSFSKVAPFFQFGVPRNRTNPPATTKWGILDSKGFITEFENGGIDYLYGLAKYIGIQRQCTTRSENPLILLSERLDSLQITSNVVHL